MAATIELPCDWQSQDIPAADINQWFGVWAMEERAAESLAAKLQSMDLTAHFAAVKHSPPSRDVAYRMLDDNIAMLEINGTMTKRGSSLSGGGTVQTRRELRAAAADPEVKGILMRIESPGGMSAGTFELAADVASAAQVKPVHAYVEDIGASAAYWVASQATHLSANQMGYVGSIGTYMVAYDMSRAYENAGVKALVFSTGSIKGAGVPGSAWTEEQIKYYQEEVQKINAPFLAGVASGRKLDPAHVQSLASGRVWIAGEAKSVGLIDDVMTFEAAVDRLRQSISVVPVVKGKRMSQDTTAPVAATSQQIRAACPGASADFVLAQLDAGATLSQAQSAFVIAQQAEIAKAQAELAAQREAIAKSAKDLEDAKAASQMPGNAPLQSSGGSASPQLDAVSEWENAVEAKRVKGMTPVNAILAVEKENPQLRKAYLAAWKPQPNVQEVA